MYVKNNKIMCSKCNGRVFVDDMFEKLEMFCMSCGMRAFTTDDEKVRFLLIASGSGYAR